MRGTVTIAIPAELTARQLGAMAALLDRIERGSWRYLASSFDRLDGAAASWPAPMAAVLQRLVVELRREAADREQAADELAMQRE